MKYSICISAHFGEKKTWKIGLEMTKLYNCLTVKCVFVCYSRRQTASDAGTSRTVRTVCRSVHLVSTPTTAASVRIVMRTVALSAAPAHWTMSASEPVMPAWSPSTTQNKSSPAVFRWSLQSPTANPATSNTGRCLPTTNLWTGKWSAIIVIIIISIIMSPPLIIGGIKRCFCLTSVSGFSGPSCILAICKFAPWADLSRVTAGQ